MPLSDRDTSTSSGYDEAVVEWEQLSLTLPGPARPPREATPPEAHRDTRRRNRFRWAARVVMLAGLLVLGFAGVRYWQDEVVTARHQSRLSAEFDQRTDLVQAGVPAAALAADPASKTPALEEDVSVADQGDDPRMVLPSSVYTQQEIAALTPEEPRIPSIIREGAPAEGEVMGRLTIPKIDLDWMFVEGVDLADLAIGPGHMPWTAVPGQPGNAVISGHRTTHGAPFFDLALLEKGDLIRVETLIGTHTYRVEETRIVSPEGMWVTTQWQGAWLTLTTCNPKYSAAERLIVFAELIDGPNAAAIHASIESVAPREPDGA